MTLGGKGSSPALSAYTPAWLAATIRPNRSRIAARGRNEPIRGTHFGGNMNNQDALRQQAQATTNQSQGLSGRQDTDPITYGEFREHCRFQWDLIETARDNAVDRAVREVFSLVGRVIAVILGVAVVCAVLIRIGMALR